MKLLVALTMMGVGRMMGPGETGTAGPPASSFHILTEAGDNLADESGDLLVTESAP